jgi:hypothetical protein
VTLETPNTPLRLSGTKPTPAVGREMASPGVYRPVYTCTIVVEKKIPRSPGKGGGIKLCQHVRSAHGKCHVTLNTGFGGAASTVSRHRPGK